MDEKKLTCTYCHGVGIIAEGYYCQRCEGKGVKDGTEYQALYEEAGFSRGE